MTERWKYAKEVLPDLEVVACIAIIRDVYAHTVNYHYRTGVYSHRTDWHVVLIPGEELIEVLYWKHIPRPSEDQQAIIDAALMKHCIKEVTK